MQNYLINLITICAEKESKPSQIWGHFMGKNEKSPYLQKTWPGPKPWPGTPKTPFRTTKPTNPNDETAIQEMQMLQRRTRWRKTRPFWLVLRVWKWVQSEILAFEMSKLLSRIAGFFSSRTMVGADKVGNRYFIRKEEVDGISKWVPQSFLLVAEKTEQNLKFGVLCSMCADLICGKWKIYLC